MPVPFGKSPVLLTRLSVTASWSAVLLLVAYTFWCLLSGQHLTAFYKTVLIVFSL